MIATNSSLFGAFLALWDTVKFLELHLIYFLFFKFNFNFGYDVVLYGKF